MPRKRVLVLLALACVGLVARYVVIGLPNVAAKPPQLAGKTSQGANFHLTIIDHRVHAFRTRLTASCGVGQKWSTSCISNADAPCQQAFADISRAWARTVRAHPHRTYDPLVTYGWWIQWHQAELRSLQALGDPFDGAPLYRNRLAAIRRFIDVQRRDIAVARAETASGTGSCTRRSIAWPHGRTSSRSASD